MERLLLILVALQRIAYSLALQGDKILVAGFTYEALNNTNDFALARYTADGRLDSSFGVNGKVITDFNNSDDRAASIALQGDKIIVAGTTYNFITNYNFALARYTADGVLDSSFGDNGKVITDLGGAATLQGIPCMKTDCMQWEVLFPIFKRMKAMV